MNEQQLAAVKQALAALEGADQIDVDMDKAITALQSIISQEALDKKAENARELGLDYEPALMQQPATLDEMHAIGNGIMYGEQPAPVQEPVAWLYKDDAEFDGKEWRDNIRVTTSKQIADWHPPHTPLYTTPPAPQPVPVKTYHDGNPWPVAPKPWVGLTDKEVGAAYDFANANSQYGHHHFGFWLDSYRAIEAKLKEKNT